MGRYRAFLSMFEIVDAYPPGAEHVADVTTNAAIIGRAGYRHDYESSLFDHALQSLNGVCILEKRLFRARATVACYSSCDTQSVRVEQLDCAFCSLMNPRQRL